MRSACWLLCLALAACAGTPPRPQPGVAMDEKIYVVRRGWHTDVAFPVAQLQGPLAMVAADFPRARYLVFGFGDREYLQHHARGLSELAALWPGEGLVLATGLEVPPQQAFGADEVVEVATSRPQVAAIAAFVAGSLRLDAAGQPRREGAGPYPGSEFLTSSQRYSGWHTCNTWTARALRAGGEPVGSAGVVFAWQLWPQVTALQAKP